MFALAKGGVVAHLKKGDALLIPDGWWHQVRTSPGRNVAVTFEFEPYEGLESLWPGDTFHKYIDGPKWSDQVPGLTATELDFALLHPTFRVAGATQVSYEEVHHKP